MKTTSKARMIAVRVTAAFLLCICLKCGAQINLLLNGDLSDFVVDSNAVKSRNYATQRINIKLPYWDEINACQTDYNPAFSKNGPNYLLAIMFQRLGEHDFRIANITGTLCRPLLADKKYLVSFYVKPFSGNAVAILPDVLFTDTIPQNQITVDEQDKLVPIKLQLTYRNQLKPTNLDSFTLVSFIYQAKGNEKYITIGNFENGKPRKWKRVNPYGYYKSNYRYAEWCMYAISNIRVIAIDTTEAGCPAKNEATAFNLLTLYFETDQSTYSKSTDSIVAVCNAYPDYTLQITGYTDNEGSTSYNQRLSEQRAASIANLLRPKVANKIVTKGLGAANPIESVSPSAKNRRVELWLVP